MGVGGGGVEGPKVASRAGLRIKRNEGTRDGKHAMGRWPGEYVFASI